MGSGSGSHHDDYSQENGSFNPGEPERKSLKMAMAEDGAWYAKEDHDVYTQLASLDGEIGPKKRL
jgi:hypothetical protein